jgi:hypothetical protein
MQNIFSKNLQKTGRHEESAPFPNKKMVGLKSRNLLLVPNLGNSFSVFYQTCH